MDADRRQVDAATQKSLNAYYGLDKPLWRQFMAYTIGDVNKKGVFICGAICGNLGPSYRTRGRTSPGYPVLAPGRQTLLVQPVRLFDALGIHCAVFRHRCRHPDRRDRGALKQNTLADYASLFIATIGISVPNFVMMIFMLIIFGTWLNLIDIVPRDWTRPKPWVVPALVLGFGTMAFTARLTRTSMLEVMRQDYIRTARAKGLKERVIIARHMLKNALIPVVTILGPALAALVTGSFIIETMVGFPGMGRAYVQSIGQRDYSMIMGTTLIYAVLVALANLSVDIIYGFVDPRIRLE